MPSRVGDFALQQPTVDSVLRWHDALVEEGLLNPVQARLRKTATAQLWKERDASAPDDASWLLNNIDALTQRMLDKGTLAATATTYKSRAAAALREYLEFRARPNDLRASKQATETRRRGRAPSDLKSFELSPGRQFRYELPRDGLSRSDVERIYLQLMAHVADLDPELARKTVQRAFDHQRSPRHGEDR